ncbi:MAG: flavodoxin domain-containing protein [Propionibacteriaceae bacterium]|jgi:menaquinone-dependent protoporphyrinogen oxidase|nr:flavodoxin domain-containing protein [Propionibacteriaceae bacterium]
MSTAVVYVTKHGTTAKIADLIAQALGTATLIDLGDDPGSDLSRFDRIVLGGPVYAGQPLKRLKAFEAAHAAELLSKPLALFTCGMETDLSQREAEIAAMFSEPLRSHAVGAWFMGGEFQFQELGFFEKAVVRRIVHVTESVTAIDQVAVTALAQALKTAR